MEVDANLTDHNQGVDAQCFTDDPSGGGCMTLLTTPHRVDPRSLTDHSSGGGCMTLLTTHHRVRRLTDHSSGGGRPMFVLLGKCH